MDPEWICFDGGWKGTRIPVTVVLLATVGNQIDSSNQVRQRIKREVACNRHDVNQ